MSCKSNSNFFQFIKQDDIEALIACYKKVKNPRVDNEESCLTMTPLLYAAYYDSIKCFNYLFLIEHESKTLQELTIPALGISSKCKYILPKNSSVIEIILLRGSINCLKSYITYTKEICEVGGIQKNDLGITPLHIAVLCKPEIGLQYFKNIIYQQQYINITTKDNMSVLMYICYFGRYDLFSILLENIHQCSDLEEKGIVKEQQALTFLRHMKIIKSYIKKQIQLKDANNYTAYDYIKIIFEDQLGLQVNKQGKQLIFQLWDQLLIELQRGDKSKEQKETKHKKIDLDKVDVQEERQSQKQKDEQKQEENKSKAQKELETTKSTINEKALNKSKQTTINKSKSHRGDKIETEKQDKQEQKSKQNSQQKKEELTIEELEVKNESTTEKTNKEENKKLQKSSSKKKVKDNKLKNTKQKQAVNKDEQNKNEEQENKQENDKQQKEENQQSEQDEQNNVQQQDNNEEQEQEQQQKQQEQEQQEQDQEQKIQETEQQEQQDQKDQEQSQQEQQQDQEQHQSEQEQDKTNEQ